MKCYCLRIIQISVLSLSTETLQSTLKRPDRLEFSFNLKQTIVLCAEPFQCVSAASSPGS